MHVWYSSLQEKEHVQAISIERAEDSWHLYPRPGQNGVLKIQDVGTLMGRLARSLQGKQKSMMRLRARNPSSQSKVCNYLQR